MSKRKICIVTGTRAEYGLLYWLMKEINDDSDLELQIIATGSHLSPEFGMTYKQIENDGFVINEKLEMLLSSDSPVGITKSLGLATIGFAEALERLKPDVIVILGDRYEALAVAQAALIARIPVAHISGGETTEGVIDEAIRHAITKMAHFHFVGADEYKRRVVQLGEQPDRVFNYGDVGLDNINRLKLLNQTELEESLGFPLGALNFLVTYHPESLSHIDPVMAVHALFEAMDAFPEAKVIITKPNADTGSRGILQMIDKYAANQPERVFAFTSLGQVRYLSTMKYCNVVIGNSSSGIVEAPILKKPTVNIGNRQSGRLKAASIIDCGGTAQEIKSAIEKSLSDGFQDRVSKVTSLYGEGNTAEKIKHVLKHADIHSVIVKKFYDIIF
ncbi:UDP-N-acetylglucosamine 2-epimerase [Brevibacillus porteri]|uniref:UDP-N-acetylglucosamine 2-epimerase (Hydrolyzing) n=1 Tax=Brevibacillus porteri TaxID=2126350 RepID=A0ABX5FR78_9BACL|nr:UDP-N-acetylglucosamine 2-epimerase [Brevibacillus porteri]MED1801453.1 UDP-N-acetylglucosamine 2-epimerase [Brevibacillus porteri]MED2133844.1 UDP-N-acetylglucosamine 2-epimerase [Brevibacillus porteri]MED2748250.1 UDP-N-acetylglucosamine 2-epimerase [Brevibacillus porteri]MED2815388.1 UDP-N-acetylglucosamine 2-epimerase [Brevibacillus porteri]MED2894805.1 UDP-N-acetylglucosamine 2-epimerase [Brevibacillus porteri]